MDTPDVRRRQHQHAARFEHTGDLSQHARRLWYVFKNLKGHGRIEAAVTEGQLQSTGPGIRQMAGLLGASARNHALSGTRLSTISLGVDFDADRQTAVGFEQLCKRTAAASHIQQASAGKGSYRPPHVPGMQVRDQPIDGEWRAVGHGVSVPCGRYCRSRAV